jgi:polyphenol oxidase
MSLVYSKIVPRGEFRVYSQKPDIPFTKVKQTHSDIIVKSKQELSQCEADGIICKDSEAPSNLCIVTADCLPIYLCGEKGVAMIHAGWKGLQKKILFNQLIKEIKPHYAFIGPHICQYHYQVGEEFREHFKNEKSLKKDELEDHKLKFSLENEALFQLKQLNQQIIIESSNLCTFDHSKLHSYRRNSTMSRNWNIFVYRD